jgi:hypothetical protein
LLEWYQGISTLYSSDYALINEHVLGVHLISLCQHFGPLYAHNCFAFESFYGSLLKWKSGTHMLQTQMLHMNGYITANKYVAQSQQITNASLLGELLEDMNIPVQIEKDRYN